MPLPLPYSIPPAAAPPRRMQRIFRQFAGGLLYYGPGNIASGHPAKSFRPSGRSSASASVKKPAPPFVGTLHPGWPAILRRNSGHSGCATPFLKHRPPQMVKNSIPRFRAAKGFAGRFFAKQRERDRRMPVPLPLSASVKAPPLPSEEAGITASFAVPPPHAQGFSVG